VGGEVLPKTDFDRTLKVNAQTTALIRQVTEMDRYKTVVDYGDAMERGQTALKANNGLGDVAAIKGIVRMFNGANSSDPEFQQIWSSTGRWNSLIAEINKWDPVTSEGKQHIFPPGMLQQIQQMFSEGLAWKKQRQAEMGDKVYNYVKAQTPGSEEEAEQQAQVAVGVVTGNWKLGASVRSKPALKGNVVKNRPTPAGATKNPDLGDE